MSLPPPKGVLTAEMLVAAAPGGNVPILKGVQFAAMPGEVLAVVGPSAAGKTTLARLLVGLWPAQQGKVRLDGVDVHTWDKEELGPACRLSAAGHRIVRRHGGREHCPLSARWTWKGYSRLRPTLACSRRSKRCRRASKPASAKTAPCSRAASASAWRWPVRSTAGHA
jgi:energy-coupling factor transporter ATP-binding protein EcfA2